MGLKISINTVRFKQDLQLELQRLRAANRPAAQAGAQLIYDRAKQLAPVSDAPHMFHGTHAVYGPYPPGTLRDSIYQAFSQDNSFSTTPSITSPERHQGSVRHGRTPDQRRPRALRHRRAAETRCRTQDDPPALHRRGHPHEHGTAPRRPFARLCPNVHPDIARPAPRAPTSLWQTLGGEVARTRQHRTERNIS